MKKLMTALSALALFAAVGAISTAQARSHCDGFYTQTVPSGDCLKLHRGAIDKNLPTTAWIDQVAAPSDGGMLNVGKSVLKPLDALVLNDAGTLFMDVILPGSSGKNGEGTGGSDGVIGHMLI